MTAEARLRLQVAQAWIELDAEDPAAVSAREVIRSRLAAGRDLKGLRRLRLIEIWGPLPGKKTLERVLHGSIQFYNPHKERCTVRMSSRRRPPVGAGTCVVVVTERGGERRHGAERWWRHETGWNIEVREGVAWVLEWAPGSTPQMEALVEVRDRRRGFLCNPHAQEALIATDPVPLPWITPAARSDG